MSHGFTLIVTDDTTCPGIELDRLGTRPGTLGGYLRQETAIASWLTEQTPVRGERVMVLGDHDAIPRDLAPHSLTFPVGDSAYRLYEQARATA